MMVDNKTDHRSRNHIYYKHQNPVHSSHDNLGASFSAVGYIWTIPNIYQCFPVANYISTHRNIPHSHCHISFSVVVVVIVW